MTRDLQSVLEEVQSITLGGWIGTLPGDGFVLKGERDPRDGKPCIRVLGHRDLTAPQWEHWVIASLKRAGALDDVAKKVWEAGVYLSDLSSYGALGRATKPYAMGTVMFIDDLWLRLETIANMGVERVTDFQKSVADRQFMSVDLLQLLLKQPGRHIAQTGGDVLYKDQNSQGLGVV